MNFKSFKKSLAVLWNKTNVVYPFFFQKKCKESTSKLGHLYRCTGCETMTVQPLGKLIKDEKNNIKYVLPKGPPVDQKCKFCQHPHLIGGAYLLFTGSTNLIKSRLRLNDGAKLWISFKLCCWINFDARKFPKFIAKYEPVLRFF